LDEQYAELVFTLTEEMLG